MTVAILKCSVPSLLACPAGKGCPRKKKKGGVRREVRKKEQTKDDRDYRETEKN